ncbi:MAG: PucR family transcriptional regulator [Chloroflexota bacterium]
MATVTDILQVALPTGSRIAAGAGGLGKPITWVAVIKDYPPLTDEVDSGDCVLISPEIQAEEELTVSLVRDLIARGVSAIGLTSEPPSAIVTLADEQSLPILVIPSSCNLTEVQKAAVALVFHRRGELERRGVQMYRQMAQLVTAGRGIGAIIDQLAEMTGKNVILQDQDFNIRFYVGPAIARLNVESMREMLGNSEFLRTWLKGTPLISTAPPIGWFEVAAPGFARFVAPVIVREKVVGYVSVLGHREELTELDHLATGRAASVCAIALDKERAVVEAENKVSGGFLQDLLEGNFLTEEAAVRRGALLGYDLTIPYVIAVLRVDVPAQSGGSVEVTSPTATAALSQVLKVELPRRSPQAILHISKEAAVVLWPVSKSAVPQLKESIESLRRYLALRTGFNVSAGISQVCHSARDLPRAYREALQTLNVVQTLLGGNQTAYADDLLIYRLLFPLQGSRELNKFYEESIGRLVEHDRRHRGELVKTLAAYFATHCNVNQTGKMLFLHRNAVTYRLKRIEAISGLSLDDPDHRLALQLGLKVKDIV